MKTEKTKIIALIILIPLAIASISYGLLAPEGKKSHRVKQSHGIAQESVIENSDYIAKRTAARTKHKEWNNL